MSGWRLARVELSARLLVAFALVVLVGAGVAWAVGALVGPSLFHAHMQRATGTAESATEHAERAFGTAAALSLSIALAAALIASTVVSVVLARRIRRSLSPLADAARRVASGERDVQVAPPGIGPELDRLAETFSSMAAQLGEVEATRTRMLADLAHEMRTPVSVLGGYLEAISEGVEQADEETLAVLRDQTARLARLTEDIALVTSAEDGRLRLDLRDVSLDEVVRAAVGAAAAAFAEAEVSLESRAEAELTVSADPDRVGQVLTNLLDNARRHTPRGGRVEVALRRDGDSAAVVVSDTGEGIAREHLARVFDRFYRVDPARDRARGGSGIGLAIARAIARAHGGTLTADSAGPGRGSTFTLRLPIVPDGPGPGAGT
ncbi:ATP-binding protein [Actinotalea sp. M2MS4P-6]|uniref:sensor histidine kinase n=1 Tax=Actinotalea sp. M2MS4P-6 TaxID=2983762 RepID=UPI0021E448C4|nr:HAMP domain-containing sensor histidine kinase [Actinotalea sp. M2MS4P-6]MCV2395722.1 ATP-binding protein [Actinotalea sp. M2MS4P-6]